ncbi:hypothetical protein [uncultured Polaribacter sp.]|mgnify:CR=1 FL=1|uniref:hypothetical protein n=1 Tax=uncultured Polaribacter sp. TaxID=174711 RepID=UPI00259BA8DA|nr:hypothetical protein [uncultured Polaribacter sp.]
MRNFLVLTFVFLVTSCDNIVEEKVKIDGLWIVKKVKVGDEEMTPSAKWMQFNSDSTQTSGNGWLQHSIGTWSLNSQNKLSVNNTNGVVDNTEPFLILLEKSKMTWSREEEGQNVQVFLERIDKIPTSEGNKLMGLWKLDSIAFDNNDEDLILQHSQTLFLRWDNTFIKHGEGKPKKYGVYKIHGHKPEIQMVNYGKNPKFTFYRFSITKERLILENTDGNEKLVYERIYQFLQ